MSEVKVKVKASYIFSSVLPVTKNICIRT